MKNIVILWSSSVFINGALFHYVSNRSKRRWNARQSERMHMTLVDIIVLQVIDFLSFFFSCWAKSTWSFSRRSMWQLLNSPSDCLHRSSQEDDSTNFFNSLSTGATFHTIEFENARTHCTYAMRPQWIRSVKENMEEFTGMPMRLARIVRHQSNNDQR